MTDHKECGRCNRKLKGAKSRERGFGPTCYKKNQEAAAKTEFERNQQRLFEEAQAG
ncbi:DUF6011 domain-containing protein [Sporomusa paucivorans]|uniref:DUF6011 domain-containing protein n=1 Tax=Sporomusa paucivorans TaxID=2376 RepID=UPI003570ABEE